MTKKIGNVTLNIDFKDKLTFVKSLLDQGNYETLARECCFILEDLMRKLYTNLIGELTGIERAELTKIESEIDSRGVRVFGLGQLIGLYKKGKVIELIEAHFGIQLTMVKAVDLNAINSIRLRLVHSGLDAPGLNVGEAQLIYNYLISWLAYLGYSALEEESPQLETQVKAAQEKGKPVLGKSRRARSNYDATYGRETERLNVQAENLKVFDRALVEKALHRIGDNEDLVVLDVGCADGIITADRFDIEGVRQVIGFDNNSTQIATAREKFKDNNKLLFYEVDVENKNFLDFANEVFVRAKVEKVDILFSSLTLHHLSDPNKALRVFRKLLGPQSVLIIRGADDGSKIGYPDNGLVNRIIERTLSQRGMSDRLYGRKIYTHLSNCGYDYIDMNYNVKDLSRLSMHERLRVFDESFSYRLDNLELQLEEDPGNKAFQDQHEEMSLMLDELEGLFTSPNFNYVEIDYAAVAGIKT